MSERESAEAMREAAAKKAELLFNRISLGPGREEDIVARDTGKQIAIAIRALPLPESPPDPREATALPDDDGEAWLIFYEDADREYELFSGCGATDAAHQRLEQLSVSWSCHLFRRVDPSKTDPRDALIGTDVSDAAIADATIARLSSDLAAAREALEEADAIINEGFWEYPSLQWMERVNASFVKTRAVLAKLAKGA